MTRTAFVVGAGIAGLAAAVKLAARGVRVSIHEMASAAGGRCRSYHDPALDMAIDNGNHLLLSGNRAALDYLDMIGARDRLIDSGTARFPFIDLKSKERWIIRANDGRIPWWLLHAERRVPGTRPWDYLALARLLLPRQDAPIGDVLNCSGPVYDRLVRPLLLAALNTEPREGSAAMAGAVLRETLAAGGRSYRPLIARDGLSDAFVSPALRFVSAHGGTTAFGRRLRSLSTTGNRVTELDFGEDRVKLAADDSVVLAVPPVVAASLLPSLTTPTEFRAIVNVHFRFPPPAGTEPITGVLNGTVEWLFAFPDRLSVTVSSADRLFGRPREELAASIWAEVAAIVGVADPIPRWQIVQERRATFAATPAQNAKRPASKTHLDNLFLAGDWTATGLPATIEGAVRSGNRAAELVG